MRAWQGRASSGFLNDATSANRAGSLLTVDARRSRFIADISSTGPVTPGPGSGKRARTCGPLSDSPVLLVSGDSVYLDHFLTRFAQSARERVPAWPLHVHVIGEFSSDRLDRLSALADATTHDVSRAPMDRAYLTASRFLRLERLLHLWNRPLLIVDIDARVAADLGGMIDPCADADVSCVLADHMLPWERAQVTAFLIRPTPGGRQFARAFGLLLASRIARGTMAYYSDQGLCWGLSQHLTRSGSGVRFGNLSLAPWLEVTNAHGVSAKVQHLEFWAGSGWPHQPAVNAGSGSG